jgi:hypothetical protein
VGIADEGEVGGRHDGLGLYEWIEVL